MKKAISTLALALGVAVSASATVKVGDIAPNFNLRDIDGNMHNLYSYLDSGYAVIIDVSAAWCGPCWNGHTSGVYEKLVDHYGKTGTITPGKIKFIFIEGESTNTTAQLRGPKATTGSRATETQGDWTAGANFPIIDDASQNTNYLGTGFPTYTVICRDRIVNAVIGGFGSNMASESFWLNIINAGCPTTPPSSTVDAKAVPYQGVEFFTCNATPTARFQNYSQTQSITSATIDVYSGSTKVATQPWTGSVGPMAVQAVPITSFSPSQFGPYRYEVTVTGDSYAGNNKSGDSLFKVYAAANAAAATWKENFESNTELPFKMSVTNPIARAFQTTGSYVLKGVDGATTRGLMLAFPEVSALREKMEVVLGNFNTAANTNVALDFDLANSMGAGTTDSKVEIMASKDCGATWTTVWSKSGAALATTTHPSGPFVASKGADWRHESAVMTSSKNTNMMIKVVGTAGTTANSLGHYAFMDNFKITNSLDVNNVIASNDVKLFPNPAKEASTLEFTLAKANAVTINVIDALGRTVSTAANGTMQPGQQRIAIPTAALAAGVYTINIQTEEGSLTQRLSVVK